MQIPHNNYLPAQLVALTVENDLNSESGKSTFMGAWGEFAIKDYLLFTPIFK